MLSQTGVATSSWPNDDAIITPCVRCGMIQYYLVIPGRSWSCWVCHNEVFSRFARFQLKKMRSCPQNKMKPHQNVPHSTAIYSIAWWRHQMETFSALLAICAVYSPVPVEFQWRRALMFSLICARINGWGNNPDAGDLRLYHDHYDVTVMVLSYEKTFLLWYRVK